jgi:hypothetical protein
MEKNLSDLYQEKYLNAYAGATTVVESSKTEQEVLEEKKKVIKKKKKETSEDEKAGGEYYADSTDFNNVFGDILKLYGEEFDVDAGDSTFDAGETGDEGFEEDEQITISKSTLTSIIEQLQSLVGDMDDEFVGDEGGVDDIPLESYGFEGGGSHVGAQANYDGKAGLLPKTDLVASNGDMKKDKVKVGGKPTKGHNGEGAHKGAQDVRNGKAGKLPQSNLVKGNGDADFGKMKTGYGKAKGEDQF